MSELASLAPWMPEEVVRQFVSEHGAKAEFQDQYGHLELEHLTWSLKHVPATAIAAASVYKPFRRWQESVATKASSAATGDWRGVDRRLEVSEHWRIHRTWTLPPILLRGSLVKSAAEYHLVEGHTRTGLLLGLMHLGIVTENSSHVIWLGELRD